MIAKRLPDKTKNNLFSQGLSEMGPNSQTTTPKGNMGYTTIEPLCKGRTWSLHDPLKMGP